MRRNRLIFFRTSSTFGRKSAATLLRGMSAKAFFRVAAVELPAVTTSTLIVGFASSATLMPLAHRHRARTPLRTDRILVSQIRRGMLDPSLAKRGLFPQSLETSPHLFSLDVPQHLQTRTSHSGAFVHVVSFVVVIIRDRSAWDRRRPLEVHVGRQSVRFANRRRRLFRQE